MTNFRNRYIIDRYDSLPNNTLFLHAERFQWHNDNPDYDGYPLLRDFQFTYLQEEGYVNLRCVWTIGCPAAIHPFEDEVVSEQHQDQTTGEIYKQAFEELLPEYPVPGEVGVSCCAQFAVTKEVIRQRPKEDYIRFRDWLLNTPFQDGLSGRFFEYSWHSKGSLIYITNVVLTLSFSHIWKNSCLLPVGGGLLL